MSKGILSKYGKFVLVSGFISLLSGCGTLGSMNYEKVDFVQKKAQKKKSDEKLLFLVSSKTRAEHIYLYGHGEDQDFMDDNYIPDANTLDINSVNIILADKKMKRMDRNKFLIWRSNDKKFKYLNYKNIPLIRNECTVLTVGYERSCNDELMKKLDIVHTLLNKNGTIYKDNFVKSKGKCFILLSVEDVCSIK